MKIRKIRRPRLPQSRSDPVGGMKLVRKSKKELDKRFSHITAEIVSLFAKIPVEYREPIKKNAIQTITEKLLGTGDVFGWVYTIDAQSLKNLDNEIGNILLQWINDGFELKSLEMGIDTTWYIDQLEQAIREGTVASYGNLSAQSVAYAEVTTLSAVLQSDRYQELAKIAFLRSYEDWTALIEQQRNKIASVITEAVLAGRNPQEIVSLIVERVGVARSLAENIAQTEITNTLRQARANEVQRSKDLLGIDVRMFWTSALLPTTRVTHASRHGKSYTVEQVRDFYSRDGNRYRCHCAVTEVIFEGGKAVLPKGIKEAYQKESKDWEKKQEKQK